MKRLVLFFCLAVTLNLNMARAEEITIAAASDLHFAFNELIPEFEQATATQVKLSLGSSGNFFAQIQHGAPFDLYFSADISYPRTLEAAGLTVPGSLSRYAVGRIVLWSSHDSPLNVTEGLKTLRHPSVRTIAIANPKHAPYGRAAVAAMKYFNTYDEAKNRLVLGENVSQAAQFVESGAADLGIIALSLARAPALKDKGTYWEIPAEAHPPLEQGAVILRSSPHQEHAKRFLAFMQSPQGQAIMTRYGFVVPESR
ncbi:MAG: molybdate ABC transporter substrate-binding protein [Nitrospira sp.]|nr:molybdate ABC transporter substrate-binding protein [Nitrospira sp.]